MHVLRRAGRPARGHWIYEDPYSPPLRAALLDAAARAGVPMRDGGCYGHVDGPRFNTQAEIRGLAAAGVTAVSQTAGPETVLAGEAELPFALVGYATDYANGVQAEATPVERLLELIAASTGTFARLLEATLPRIDARGARARRASCTASTRGDRAAPSCARRAAAAGPGCAGERAAAPRAVRAPRGLAPRRRARSPRAGRRGAVEVAATRSRRAARRRRDQRGRRRCWSCTAICPRLGAAHAAAALADLERRLRRRLRPDARRRLVPRRARRAAAGLLPCRRDEHRLFARAREHGAEVGLLRHERALPTPADAARCSPTRSRRPTCAPRSARLTRIVARARAGDPQVRVAEGRTPAAKSSGSLLGLRGEHAVVAGDALDLRRAGERARAEVPAERRRGRTPARRVPNRSSSALAGVDVVADEDDAAVARAQVAGSAAGAPLRRSSSPAHVAQRQRRRAPLALARTRAAAGPCAGTPGAGRG